MSWEINTLPSLVAFWDFLFAKIFEDNAPTPWLQGHLDMVQAMVQNLLADEYVFDGDPTEDKQNEDHGSEDPEADFLEAQHLVCCRLAIIIRWCVSKWEDFTKWLIRSTGIKDVPEVPEIEFLLYYAEVAGVWARNVHYGTISNFECWMESMFMHRDRLDQVEAEFHQIAKDQHEGYTPIPWSDEDRVEILDRTGVSPSMVLFAVRYWKKWEAQKDNKEGPRDFSFELMIDDLLAICDWAFDLANPEGGIVSDDGDDEHRSCVIPSAKKENDYWPGTVTEVVFGCKMGPKNGVTIFQAGEYDHG